MNNTDETFNGLGRSLLKYLVDSLGDKNGSAVLRFLFILLAILCFIGAEAVKVVFRTNFGRNGINMAKIISCSILFAGISFSLLFLWNNGYPDLKWVGMQKFYLPGGVFYGFLSLVVLFKAIFEKSKPARSDVQPLYQGDSTAFGFLSRYGWSQSSIQHVAEPLWLLCVGAGTLVYGFLLGIPIIFCAISVWVHPLIEAKFRSNHIRDTINQKGHQTRNADDFSPIQK